MADLDQTPQNGTLSAENANINLLQCRVYIAGILLPTISVNIRCVFNEPPTAEIALPAYPELFSLGEADRVPVHVFVQETMVESPHFILLFEGFIESKVYMNSPLERSVTINAISYFDILGDCKVRFMTQLDDMFLMSGAGNQEQAAYVATSDITFPHCLFRYGLNPLDNGLPIKYPSQYLENIYAFMQMAGQTDPKTGEEHHPPLGQLHASKLSQYFRDQAEALKLLDRFEYLPYFDKAGNDGTAWKIAGLPETDDMATAFPMIYGMQTFHAMELLVRGAVNASEEQTLRELLTFLVDEMEYEYLYIANPAYHAAIPADAGSGTGEKNGAEQAQTGMEKDTGTQEKDIPARLVSSCMKPLLTDSLPPQCNVLHRTLVTSIQTSQKYKGSPTRIQIRNLFGPLAQLVSGNTSSKLAQTGLLDFYPSETYQNFEVPDALLKNGIRTLSNELLKVEEFTGPWVRQVGTPRWFHYIPFMNSGVQDNTGSTLATEKIFKERFCRRQLLNLKYAPRQLTATCQFAPYVTPGFPGVVFDNNDTHFAFAGHVLAVEHSISGTEVRTSISMNFARLLKEAATIPINHPLTAVDNITQSQSRMTEIYQTILGTPGAPGVPGADAVSYETLLSELTSPDTSTASPHSNPREAYRYMRRNIVTFEDYCAFMGFTATYGSGPEGPQTPLQLNGDFLEKRRPLKIFKTVTGKEAGKETGKEEEKREKSGNGMEDGSSNMPEKELIGSFDEGSNDSGTGSVIDSRIGPINGTANDTASGTADGTQGTGEKGAADKIMDKIMEKARDKSREGTKKDGAQILDASEAITEVESDVRALLLQIQAKEFATMVYE